MHFIGTDHIPAGKIMNEVVSLLDIGPTIMSLAGVPDRETWISEMDGKSFDWDWASMLKTI